MASVYVPNRCCLQRTKENLIFFSLVKKPDVSGMHVLGSTCYPCEVKKQKLDNCNTKGAFLGYDKGSSAYIIYYPDTKRILLDRVVTFTDVINFDCGAIYSGDGDSVDRCYVHVEVDDFPGVISTKLPDTEGEEAAESVDPVILDVYEVRAWNTTTDY